MNNNNKTKKQTHPKVDCAGCETLVDDGYLTSFELVRLVTELGDAFDVAIPASQIVPENFNSVQAIDALIKRLEGEE